MEYYIIHTQFQNAKYVIKIMSAGFPPFMATKYTQRFGREVLISG